MAEFIHFSGQYKRWTTHKKIGVPFFARKVYIPHLSKVFSGNIRRIDIQLNGEKISDWMISDDSLHFGKTILRGDHWLFIEITYNELEPTVYRKWNE